MIADKPAGANSNSFAGILHEGGLACAPVAVAAFGKVLLSRPF